MNVGLGKFCNTQTAIGCVGRDALLRVAKEGPVQQIRAIAIGGDAVPGCDRAWPLYGGGQDGGAGDLGGVVAGFWGQCGDWHGAHDPLGRRARSWRWRPISRGCVRRRCRRGSGIRGRAREFVRIFWACGESIVSKMKEIEMFNALVVEKDEESGKTSAAVKELALDRSARGRCDGCGRVFDGELQGRAVHWAGWRSGAQLSACAGH